MLDVTLKEGKGQDKQDVAKLKPAQPEKETSSAAADIDEMNQRLLDENETVCTLCPLDHLCGCLGKPVGSR
jgi:hypothetical protein